MASLASVVLLLLLLPLLACEAQLQSPHPLPFSLCGVDRLGLQSIFLNEWPVVPGTYYVHMHTCLPACLRPTQPTHPSISTHPPPPSQGKDLTIQATYTPNVTVTGGQALATVHVLGIPLTETRDVCSEPGTRPHPPTHPPKPTHPPTHPPTGVTCPLVKGKRTTTVFR